MNPSMGANFAIPGRKTLAPTCPRIRHWIFERVAISICDGLVLKPDQTDGNNNTGDKQLNQAEAHNIFRLEARNGEHWQCPEGL